MHLEGLWRGGISCQSMRAVLTHTLLHTQLHTAPWLPEEATHQALMAQLLKSHLNLKEHLLSISLVSCPTGTQIRNTTYFTIGSWMRAEDWVYFLGNVVTKLFLVEWIYAKPPVKFSVESTDCGKSGRKQAAGVSAGGRAASPALSALWLY